MPAAFVNVSGMHCRRKGENLEKGKGDERVIERKKDRKTGKQTNKARSKEKDSLYWIGDVRIVSIVYSFK